MTDYFVALAIFFVSLLGSLIAPRVFVFFVLASFVTDLRFGGPDMPFSLSLQELFVFGFLIAFLIHRYSISYSSFKHPISVSVLSYSLLMVLSTIPNFREDPPHMLSVIRDTLVPLLWFILLVNYLLYVDKGSVRRYLHLLIWVGLVSSALGFTQHFLHQFLFFNEELNRDYLSLMTEGSVTQAYPSTGFFSYFNAYGMFIQMPLLICAVFVFYTKGNTRIRYAVAASILLLAEYFSYSRGSYLSFIIAFLAILMIGTRRFRLAGYFAISTVIILLFSFVIPYFLNSPAETATLFGRFQIWGYGYSYFKMHSSWIYGMGPGMFTRLVGTFMDVHNEYLMHLFENGVIGLVALLSIIIVFVGKSFSLFKKFSFSEQLRVPFLAFFVIFIGYFVQESVEHTFYSIVFRLIIFSLGAFVVKAEQEAEGWKQDYELENADLSWNEAAFSK